MDWLNYHHLLYFQTVAKEGGLRKASEKLRVSQSSISAQVSALEEALGEKLFQPSGRTKVLTEMGQVVLGYAEEISSLGREMMNTVKHQASTRPVRLHVGVADSVPKLIAYEIIKPVLRLQPSVRMVCREGKVDALLGLLAAQRLDIVLADEPASSVLKFKTFNHLLGASDVSFYAAPPLAGRLQGHFPQSLHGAPALLPAENTAFRMALETWFDAHGIRPHVIAEFEDTALMHPAALDGVGFVPVHTVISLRAARQNGWKVIGRARQCTGQFYAITAERRLKHPAIVTITEHAQSTLFA
jgi:LysR family transcriptional activator of nhaA